ncbi:MAG TPA: ABC transporter permease [Natronosporangium sp.]|nr:ABC transporter permease [Natronosporangium sp.]
MVDAPTRPAAATPATGTTFWAATRLVAENEIRSIARTKGFWITLSLMLAGLFALAILPGVFGGGTPTVATVGADAERLVAEAGLDPRPVADQAEAEALVRAEEVDAAVVPDPSGESAVGLRVVGLSDTPSELVSGLSITPPVDLLEPFPVSDAVQAVVAITFALVFLMLAMAGIGIAQSVVTEKQTRIVEILVATIPIRALLAGKIAGHSIMIFIQAGALALATPLALRLGRQPALLDLIGDALAWFVPFFILGFVLLGAMWAVAGSLVSRQEDLSSSMSVVMLLVMGPYFAVIFLSDNDLAMTILSYVPFSAAVAMPLRLFAGQAQAWEPFVSMLVLALATVATVLVASRLYAGSLLQTGGRVRLSRAWSGAE